jgi:hypothetical protein
LLLVLCGSLLFEGAPRLLCLTRGFRFTGHARSIRGESSGRRGTMSRARAMREGCRSSPERRWRSQACVPQSGGRRPFVRAAESAEVRTQSRKQ